MPKIKTKNSMPPAGFDVVEPTLLQLEVKMRDAEAESHEGKRKVEALWPIFRIHHQRSRYIYEMFHKKHEISREVYDYCLREGYADANLIAKWKKPGYDRLCCLRCIQSRDTNFGTACICRVPKADLEAGKIVQCVHCGCRGCASGDSTAVQLDLRAGTATVVAGGGERKARDDGRSHPSGGSGSERSGGSSSAASAGARGGSGVDASASASAFGCMPSFPMGMQMPFPFMMPQGMMMPGMPGMMPFPGMMMPGMGMPGTGSAPSGMPFPFPFPGMPAGFPSGMMMPPPQAPTQAAAVTDDGEHSGEGAEGGEAPTSREESVSTERADATDAPVVENVATT